MAHANWNYKKNNARSLNASDTINTIFFYEPHTELEVISIDNWRVVTTKPNNNSDQKSHQQNNTMSTLSTKQYHVYFFMTMENLAHPIFRKVGFTSKKVHSEAQLAVECACCEICFYNLTFNLK